MTENTRGLILSAMMILLSAGSSSGEFKITESKVELRKIRGIAALEDLAVQERGVISLPLMCSSNGSIYLSGETIIAETASDYGPVWSMQRLPQNKVALHVEKGKQYDKPLKEAIAQTLSLALFIPCTDPRYANADRFELESINGVTSSRELFSATP